MVIRTETSEMPLGASRRCTTRVPPSVVGIRVKDQIVQFSRILKAIFCSGTNSVTIAWVGQNSRPSRLMLISFAPSCMAPPRTMVLRHCGLQRGMLRRSETSSQTAAGGAAISIVASMGATSVRGTGFSWLLRPAAGQRGPWVFSQRIGSGISDVPPTSRIAATALPV